MNNQAISDLAYLVVSYKAAIEAEEERRAQEEAAAALLLIKVLGTTVKNRDAHIKKLTEENERLRDEISRLQVFNGRINLN